MDLSVLAKGEYVFHAAVCWFVQTLVKQLQFRWCIFGIEDALLDSISLLTDDDEEKKKKSDHWWKVYGKEW